MFAVSVGAIQSVVLSRVDGSSRALSAAAGTASGADISGGTLSSNTWYYLYAYDNSGSVSYEISATSPSSARVFKTGDVTRRYLGCFRTNGSGAPIPMRAHGGRFTFRLSAVGTDTQALSTTSAAPSATDVALSSFVPPHTRAARVQATVTSSGGATVLNLLTKGDLIFVSGDLDGTPATNCFMVNSATGAATVTTVGFATVTQTYVNEYVMTDELSLTDGTYQLFPFPKDMMDAAWIIIEEVEAMGGMTQAVDSGWAKLKIEAAAAGESGPAKLNLLAYTGAPMDQWWLDHPVVVDLAVMREALASMGGNVKSITLGLGIGSVVYVISRRVKAKQEGQAG